jgi:acyl-CoA reductase-like NAD-dependent aldehyde dehydrogenase
MISSTCRVIYGGRHHDRRRAAIRSAHDSTIVETTFDSAVMREEVFGPVLAIVPVPSVDDALRLVI